MFVLSGIINLVSLFIYMFMVVYLSELLKRNGLGFIIDFIYYLVEYSLSLMWEVGKNFIAKYYS